MNFDPETGEVLDGDERQDQAEVLPLPGVPSRERLAQLEAEKAELEVENGRLRGALVEEAKSKATLRGQLSEARGERNRQARKSPFAADARRVFEYWQEQLEPEAREFTDERFDKVVTRLSRGATVEELCEAVDGCKALPYVGDHGRSATGELKDRHTELALICQSERHVMRFRRYAPEGSLEAKVPGTLFADAATNEADLSDAGQPDAKAERAFVVQEATIGRLTPLERVTHALRFEFGVDRVDVSLDADTNEVETVWAPCPVCRSPLGRGLVVFERGWAGSLVFVCAAGCGSKAIFDALTELERRHEASAERVKAAAAAARLLMAKYEAEVLKSVPEAAERLRELLGRPFEKEDAA
jgi:hypothetical protein